VTGSDPEVMPFDGSHLQVPVKGRKLAYTVHFTSYKAVALSRRESRQRKWLTWPGVTGSDPDVTSFARKSPGRGCEGRKLAYTVHFTSYKAVACSRRSSHDMKWHHVTRWSEVTRKWRHFTGSHLEAAVDGRKLA